MNREEKSQFVKDMNAQMQDVEWAFLLDYRGLTVAEVSELRRSLREIESNYKVVKNTLTKLAIKGTPVEPLAEYFEGPIAMAWTKSDPVVLAKTLVDYSKDKKKLEFKAGILSGQVLDAAEFKQLSSLPGREELLAKFVYVISHPVRGFVTALNEINAGFVRVLDSIKTQKEEN